MNVARDEEVNVAIAIVVGPRSAGREAAAADSSLVGDVFESAIAFVAVERVAAVSGDEEIEVAIVIEVGDGDTHAPTFASESSFLSDVGEFEVGVLMPERNEWISATLFVAIDGRAVDHEDVEFAIIVAIEEAHAAAHGFDDVVFFGGGNVGGSQSSLGGDVAEDGDGSGGFGGRFLFSSGG